ncbi:protein US26 [Mandrillus leucophaeus cytomegalovirus]|uniref:Protein US26 n=1 Tax=Mandrillus leucophaeus cytomegalovirus TaxID=1654930 RepID=A0A0G2UHY4_9BETA|nr:protein US26 [Mandrillus leucophaeus cytomegalovirus]AKI29729.1 protein US26 [Mandrillus leucophaeus cytomegalovirus]
MMRQCYRYASVSCTRQTLFALKDVFTHQDSQTKLRTLVSLKAECRSSVPVSAPPGWRMVFATFPSIFGSHVPCHGPHSPWGRLICCEEPLEVLGYLQYWNGARHQQEDELSDEADSDDEYCDDSCLYAEELRPPSKARRIVLMGRYESLWLLDRDQNVLYYVASGLDDFARHGVLQCESIYTGKFRMPMLTTEPDDIISILRLNDYSMSHLKCAMAAYRWQCIPLRTPGEMTRPLMLCGDAEDLKSCWPFLCMDETMFSKLMQFFRDRLCCELLVFGVVGEVLPSGVFHSDWVVLMDAFGEFFVFSVYRREVMRLADDLDSLLTMGLLKLYQAGRRFSCALSDAERLEVPAHCPHGTYQFWDRYLFMDRRTAQHSFETRFKWLTRKDRFAKKNIDGCYVRNSCHDVAGAADASWEPHVRCDFPQATEVEAAHNWWRRVSEHVQSKDVKQGTRCYSIWTQLTPQLEREISRLRSRLTGNNDRASSSRDPSEQTFASKSGSSSTLTRPPNPQTPADETPKPQRKPQKPPRSQHYDSHDNDLLEIDGPVSCPRYRKEEHETFSDDTDSNGGEGTGEGGEGNAKEGGEEEPTCDYYTEVLLQRAAKAALLEGRPFPRPAIPRPGSYLPPWL